MRILKKAAYFIVFLIAALAFVLVAVPYMLPIGQQQPTTQLPFSNSHFIQVNGVLLHFRVFEPSRDSIKGNVVMIHGFCGSTFSWRNNAGVIAGAGYRVICVDLPGYGFSSRRQGINHSPAQSAMLVWQLLDSLGGGRWHLFGHSMGASAAAAMAAMRPQQTKSLWLFDGFSYNRMQKTSANRAATIITSAPARRWAEVLAHNYFFKFDKMKQLLQSAYGQVPDSAAVQGYLRPLLLPGTASAIMDIGSSVGANAPVYLNHLPVPVFFVWGSNDTWLPFNKFKADIEGLPNAKLLLVTGAGHCAMETHSTPVNRFVLTGLNTIP